MRPTPEEDVVRAARVYRTNKDAATALGITAAAFARLCKRLGIATPHQRRRGVSERIDADRAAAS